MTSPEALAAVADIWFVNSDGSEPSRVELADIIDRHFAPLRAERDALALRCAAMEKAIQGAISDASGRSGGSVYMIHREQFLALRAALSQPAQLQT